MFSLPRTASFRLGIFVAILESFSAIALIATSAYLISRASEQPPVLYLMMAVVGVRAFALGRAFFRYVQRLALHDATFSHVARIRPIVFEKLSELSPGAQGGSSGEKLSKVTDQVDELQNYPIKVFGPAVQALAALVFSLVVVGFWFPLSSLVVFALSLVSIFLSQLLTWSLAARSEALRVLLNGRLRSELVEYLQAAELIEAFGWSFEYRARINSISEQIDGIDSRAAISFGVSGSLFSFFAVVAAAASGYLAAAELDNVPGHLLAVAVLTPLALFEFLAMAGNTQQARGRYLSAKRELSNLISTDPKAYLRVQDGPESLGTFESLEIRGQVEFGEKTVPLPHLRLNRGEFVAVMGESGVGKSTLGYVMASLYSNSGLFTINGSDSSTYSLSSRRRVIGLCEQIPQLFPGSVSVNLAVSGDADPQRQIAVLNQLGLLEEIRDRGGLDLELTESGSGLSGGQRQRLTIARALLAGAQVLVLDEPTSGLDWDNTTRFLELLKDLNQEGITILLITHDPQLSKFAQRVEVLS